MTTPIELLAPAGNLEKLHYAVHYGADAVYFAGNRFGLRAFAGNFSDADIKAGVAFAHAHGVKAYVTLNAYPHNEGLIGLKEYALFLESTGVDAFIVADPGVYRLIRAAGVHTPIHISTQATMVNWAGVQFWQDMPGVERVVLARELSLTEIQEIRQHTDIELEIFVHGAMCMSYSGRCLLSNYMAGRDANQGECAQPCRWNYALVEEKRPGVYYPVEEDAHGSYVFNSHDLCTLAHLEDIVQSGAASLKIEGRMKSLYYVSTVLRAYRHILDGLKQNSLTESDRAYWLAELEKVSHRPYTSGFFYGRPEDHAINNAFAGTIQPYDFCGVVLDYDANTGLAKIEQRNKMQVGETVQFFGRQFKEADHHIQAMWDEKHTPITTAPHPQQVIHLKLPFAVQPMDLIRKKMSS